MDTRKLGFTAPHSFYKFQSDKRIRSSEDLNFAGEKSITQWWYFDCALADGSFLIFMFTPFQWWSESEKMPTHKALACVSYLNPNGEVVTYKDIFNASDVQYTDRRISCNAFTLERNHTSNSRHYKITFNLNEVKGTLDIQSSTKAFSPFPGGAMGEFLTKYILKLAGDKPLFRYAAHVPHGQANCDLRVNGAAVKQLGKAYHEQGMFRGSPEQLGVGWAWTHFISKSFNIFGKPQDFVCLEKNNEKIISGTTFFDRGVVLSDLVYDSKQKNLIVGGKLDFKSKKLSFTVTPAGISKTLIAIPSSHTVQLWGTVAQPSIIRYSENGITIEETGWLLLETCKMGGSKGSKQTKRDGESYDSSV